MGLVWFGLIWICSLELGNNEGNLKEITVIESEKLNQNIGNNTTNIEKWVIYTIILKEEARAHPQWGILIIKKSPNWSS